MGPKLKWETEPGLVRLNLTSFQLSEVKKGTISEATWDGICERIRTRMLRTFGAFGRQLNSGYLNAWTEVASDGSRECALAAGTRVERRRIHVIKA